MNRLLALPLLFLLMMGCPSADDDDAAGDDDDATADDDDATADDDDATGDDDDATEDACPDADADNTVGLQICTPDAHPGYTLFGPLGTGTTYLLDLNGRIVHTWESAYPPGNSLYLLDDGDLLRTGNPQGQSVFSGGGQGGIVERISWDGTVEWSFTYSDDDVRLHHDIEPMPDGNILMIAWEYKSEAEAVQAGRNPAVLSAGELWPDHVIEVDPSSDAIVWEWHLWDHLVQDVDANVDNFGVVADNPQLVDINATRTGGANPGPADWNHVNAIEYNAALDQIVLSSHNQHELWVIDHSTTTAEAAGHTGGNSGRGGDLLYRWGNPSTWDGPGDQVFEGQHDTQWIPEGLPGAGDLLIFDNGNQRGWSAVRQITPPVDADGSYPMTGSEWGPTEATWEYVADPQDDFYSSNISGAQRLPNGNTLICEGAWGRLFEVTEAGEIVWQYVSPVTNQGILDQGDALPGGGNGGGNSVFRATRIDVDHPALQGRDLTPQGTVEG